MYLCYIYIYILLSINAIHLVSIHEKNDIVMLLLLYRNYKHNDKCNFSSNLK